MFRALIVFILLIIFILFLFCIDKIFNRENDAIELLIELSAAVGLIVIAFLLSSCI